ncbi:MAG TPA: M24 family metallopeptidase [Ktedonobacterales bacterium]|nr:M24 family metallopeptidase [Ktedonobacterales bacterium]
MMEPQIDRVGEVTTKLQRLRAQMAAREVDAVVLNQLPNIAWLTAGASTYINLASDTGPSALLVTLDSASVITDRIEAGRLEQEEALPALGFTLAVEPWDRRGAQAQALVAGKRLAQDGPGPGIDLSGELQALRTHLQAEEVERLQYVGSLASAAIAEVMAAVQPGMTEYAIAGLLAQASLARGGHAVVNLVASDERIARYRHPLPTSKSVERYVMVVLCLRCQGLIAAVTRLVHFGPIPDELAAKAQAVANVDARMILGTRPGKTLGVMHALAARAYREAGYPADIEEHHQGGSIAYLPREVLAQPNETAVIAERQAFAWNPSVRGAKSEDTIIAGPAGPAVITQTPGWPMVSVTIDGQTIERPAILER